MYNIIQDIGMNIHGCFAIVCSIVRMCIHDYIEGVMHMIVHTRFPCLVPGLVVIETRTQHHSSSPVQGTDQE